METELYSLDLVKGNKVTRIFQLIFGIVCFAVAVIWLLLNGDELNPAGTFWITIIFLAGFGFYQIRSGLGLSAKFIEISNNGILLKKNSLFPAMELKANDMEKIEIFPLNIVFYMKHGKTVLLRFGTTYTDLIEPVRKKIEDFAGINKLPLEFISEEF